MARTFCAAAIQEDFVRNVRKQSLGRALFAALATALVAVCAPGLARAGDGPGGDRTRAFVPQSLLEAAAANRAATFPVIVTAAEGTSARVLENVALRDAAGGALGDVTRRYNVIDALA